MEVITMRKDIYERIKILRMDEIKPNFAELAKTWGCDYRTAKKYFYNENDEPSKRKYVPSKLDPYKSIIDEKLKLCCSYYSIYKFIQKKGYDGKYTILQNYCSKFKENETKKATIRFETNPGLQAQVDWKETMTLHYKSGDPITFNIFLILLGFSRLKYIELTLDRSQDTVFKSMINAFHYFGGIPKEIIFDNMKTVVDHAKSNYTEAVLNESFYQFSRDFGFEAWTCRPYRPQTKGKVEALARTMERLRPYDYEFDSFDELENIIKSFNDELNNEISQATNQKPFKLLEKEKEYLRNLPNIDIIRSYMNVKDVTRIVSKEALVTYDNRKYSVDPQYIGKTVSISVSDDTLCIYFNKSIIKTHKITQKKFNYAKDDYINILKSDAMKTASSEDIEKMANINLSIYDEL